MTEFGPVDMFTLWCSNCSAEPATITIEVEMFGKWTDFPVGEQCLTRLREEGKIE